jgi:hypothetical protein
MLVFINITWFGALVNVKIDTLFRLMVRMSAYIENRQNLLLSLYSQLAKD